MSVTISSTANIDSGTSNNDEFKIKSPTTANCFWSPDTDFEFISPPEAPVFRPTPEEFAKGPLHYINKIRPLAESHGICKIIPPATFQPPFTVDVEKFRFTPRVQRLNELEAQTRVKLNFLEQIIKYWDLQGATLKIPTVERKILDLHLLHKVVQEEGGFETCTRDRKWSRVAAKMGFLLTSHNKGTVASLLRQHYERILYPYDVFLSGATIGPDFDCDFEIDCTATNIKIEAEEGGRTDKDENGNLTKDPSEEKKQLRPIRRARRMQGQQRSRPTFQDKELKKLQVYGAGPKMPGILNNDPSDKSLVCIQCNEDQYQHQLLKCAVCGGLYHCYCLIPPLNDVPKGVWHCARCVAYLVQTQPQPFTHEFGFVQSQRDYSLSEFGEMADQFKRNYFHMPPHSVPLTVVEKEFWRLVASMEDTVTVEYGADLQTNDYGSGFPTKKTPNLLASDKEYIENLWNLNNLPVLEGSVFKYMNSNISGMIIPWMYVGMCFSTFCWHNEDHWSYSINYLHWGEAKSWYGVPGEHADTFERAMKRAAPELFSSQPDLLHQLVTICNPNLLMQDGVPIYKTFQQAGEFVVTFPRSYHAGFNQGLNFAEAVNFAPADWLVLGRDCMNHYSSLNRYPVFSHDELICKMACDPDNLDITIASATYDDMIKMVQSEKQLRLLVLSWGVKKSKRIPFELLHDDERQCDVCRTTCFLSALTCPCSEKLVCIEHKESLCSNCSPDDLTLKYRYTLDELPTMLDGMRLRREFYEEWINSVEDAFNRKPDERVSFEELKELLRVANKKRFPLTCKIYNELKEAVEEVDKSSKASRELLERQNKMDEILNLKRVRQEFQETVSSARLKKKAERNEEQNWSQNSSLQQQSNQNKVRINTRSSARVDRTQSEAVNDKLTLEELSLFHDEIESYVCVIPEAQAIKAILDRCVDISTRIIDVLKCCTIDHNHSDYDERLLTSQHLSSIIEDSEAIAIVTFGKQLEKIKCKLEEVRWLEEATNILQQQVQANDAEGDGEDRRRKCVDIKTIRSLIESGMSLSSLAGKSAHETLINLQDVADDYDKWIEKSTLILESKSDGKEAGPESQVKMHHSLRNFEQLLEEAENLVTLRNLDLNPNLQRIKEVIIKGKQWKEKVVQLFDASHSGHPFIDTYEKLISDGNRIGCFLDNMSHLTSTVAAVNSWKDRLSKMFFRKSFPLYSLTSILTPRSSHTFASTFDVDNYSLRLLYQQLKKQSSQTKEVKRGGWFEKLLSGNSCHQNIASVYRSCVANELHLLRRLREKNIHKFERTEEEEENEQEEDDEEEEENEEEEAMDQVSCALNENENEKKMNVCGEVDAQDCVLKENGNRRSEETSERAASVPVTRFCFCDKKASDWMIRCQVCFEWYHQSCVQTFLTTINSTGRGRKNAQQQQQQQLLLKDNHYERQNFVCMICNRGRRPQIEAVRSLLVSLQKIPCRVMDGELLECLVQRVSDFQEKLNRELSLNQDLSNLYNLVASLKLSLLSIPSSPHSTTLPSHSLDGLKDFPHGESVNSQQQQHQQESPLKNKRKTPLVLRGELSDHLNPSKVQLSQSSKSLLFELLWEANLLEIFTEEGKNLWNAWLSINPSYKVAVHIDSTDSPPYSLFDLSWNAFESCENSLKRRLMEEANEKSDCKKKRSEKRSRRRTEKPEKRKNRRGKQNRRSKKSGHDVCSMMEKCLKPNGEEVNWVLCEGPCSSWFHQLCAGIQSPEEIEGVEKYFCDLCKQERETGLKEAQCDQVRDAGLSGL